MSHNPAMELGSAIQSMSIKRDPSPHHDINPSTAASKKIPATVHSPTGSVSSSIPSDVIRPRPRRKSFPPIPDFRFEQSYLASIKSAETWWQVAYITTRDQVLLPLTQGIVWNMAQIGWRFWNRGAKFRGVGLGARIRRWWWDVNNWKMPNTQQKQEFSKEASEYYVDKLGSSMGD